VSILWAERTNENLVKSINPLGEVEIRITNNQGGVDTRYLQFDFHRVRVDGKITHVLVSVSDITAQVDLARELTARRARRRRRSIRCSASCTSSRRNWRRSSAIPMPR
jgi:two-component system, chemotaxis family, sensor kinase CheA